MLHRTVSLLAFASLLVSSTLAQSSASSASVTSTVSSSSPSASSSTSNAPASTSSSAVSPLSIVQADGDYTYAGCWNETTLVDGANNVRALAGGIMKSDTSMTPETCIAFCSTNVSSAYNYAGLEYGRECWCATYLSALSTKLRDADCNINCAAKPGYACGGSLVISLYNKTGKSTKKSDGVTSFSSGQQQWWTILGTTVAVLGLVGL